jgi:Low-density lipoprotein receptor repeat class B
MKLSARKAFVAAVAVLALASHSNADIFTQDLSLALPSAQNPFFVQNAFLREETFDPHVRYWQPTTPNVVGIVTFKFDLPFGIQTAQLTAGITSYTVGSDFNFDSNATTYLDVSTDDTNWTTIASQTNLNAVGSGTVGPWDISSIVAGSNVVYARSRMLMTTNYSGFGPSQFLRQGQPYGGDSFTATGSPPRQFFWTDPGGVAVGSDVIRRAHPDGSGIQTVAAGLEEPRGMALDLATKRMYWADPGARAIQASNMDGSGPIQNVVATGDGSGGIALDVPNGKMYWTDSDAFQINHGGLSGQIHRANLDGSSPENIVTGLVQPAGIALDPSHGKVYWTELDRKSDGMGSIQRANLDGSSVETILTGIDEANGLALDPIHGKLYWPELTTHSIQTSNLDGSDLHNVLTGLDSPTNVALDIAAGRIYWTNSGGQQANQIDSANFDGSGTQTLVTGVGAPWGIAIVPEPSSLALAVMRFIGFALAGWRRVKS